MTDTTHPPLSATTIAKLDAWEAAGELRARAVGALHDQEREITTLRAQVAALQHQLAEAQVLASTAMRTAFPEIAAAHPDALPREEFAALVVQEACETEPADPDDPKTIRILTRDLHSAVLAAFLRRDAA